MENPKTPESPREVSFLEVVFPEKYDSAIAGYKERCDVLVGLGHLTRTSRDSPRYSSYIQVEPFIIGYQSVGHCNLQCVMNDTDCTFTWESDGQCLVIPRVVVHPGDLGSSDRPLRIYASFTDEF